MLFSVGPGPYGCQSKLLRLLGHEINTSVKLPKHFCSFLHTFELLIFYALPAFVTLFLDVRVIFTRLGFSDSKKLTGDRESLRRGSECIRKWARGDSEKFQTPTSGSNFGAPEVHDPLARNHYDYFCPQRAGHRSLRDGPSWIDVNFHSLTKI